MFQYDIEFNWFLGACSICFAQLRPMLFHGFLLIEVYSQILNICFIEEYVAHGSDVKCLALGQNSGQMMVTGGDDKKVNVWSLNKPNCLLVCRLICLPQDIVAFTGLKCWFSAINLSYKTVALSSQL